MSDIATLQRQLAAACARIVQLERAELRSQVAALRTDLDTTRETLGQERASVRTEFDDAGSERFRLANRIDELAARIDDVGRVSHDEGVRFAEILERGQERVNRIERDLNERIAHLERDRLAVESQQAAIEPLPRAIPSAVSFASPTLSDAPPTRSLAGFDSPSGSPAPPQVVEAQSTRRIATLAPVSAHKATPFRFGPSTSSSSSSSFPTRASAIPSHLLASNSRKSPRASHGVGGGGGGESQAPSPAIPLAHALLGKRCRRESEDGSNSSIQLEEVASPFRERESSGAASANSSESLSLSDVTPSRKREDGHSRKKLRMSALEDDGSDGESDQVHVARQDEDGDREDDDDGELDDPEVENSCDSVRDYLMPTKTGDSPVTAFRPRPPPPAAAAVATSDPAFFSAPGSPVRSSPGRRSRFDENDRPSDRASSSSRKSSSLPLSDLPFPLVSPFSSDKTCPSAVVFPALTGRGGGTPAAPRFGTNVSNQRLSSGTTTTTGFEMIVASKSTSSKEEERSLLPPRTPPASRTLFGTETFPFSDGGFDEEDAPSRYGRRDRFETAEEGDDTSNGTEPTWSRFGHGAFSSRL